MQHVGLVVVSHSSKIAEGVVDLATQMAPHVVIRAAGGTDDGRIGTSFDRVSAAIAEADAGAGVVLLCDLGSAVLTAETAVDFLDPDVAGRVLIADAPVVEGAVAAAVAAETGGTLDEVIAAAQSAGGARATDDESETPAEQPATSGYARTLELINKDGLHARPAADLVKLAASLPAPVTVNGTSAKSLLGIMALGLTRGATVTIAASDDEDGRHSVDALAELVATGFGEA